MANPEIYTPELAAQIVEWISQGNVLTQFCRDHGFSKRTVTAWRKKYPEFDSAMLDARDEGYLRIAEKCLEIADTPQDGVEEVTNPDGSVIVKKGDMLGHRKLQVETRKWLLRHWHPTVYGDRQQVEHSGTLTLEQLVSASLSKPDGK